MEAKQPDKKEYNTAKFLFTLTIIQFWWIAIWGIAYILMSLIAGKSKIIEISIYLGMMIITAIVIHNNPKLLQHL
jgi:hypothetical protein